MSLFDLTGKNAIVTGSTRGIGRAIAEELVAHGARVVISSRKQDQCDAVAAEINDKAGDERAIAIAASLSDKQALLDMAARATERFGQIDVLVCNAAVNPYYGPMSGISDDQFRRILDNNIIANHWLVQAVAPAMCDRKDGSIVIISSIGGLHASAVIGAYNVSKAADFQLARNLASEFGPHNVRVNCIAPGLIKTDFARALWEDEKFAGAIRRSTPMGRIGEPREIAGAAVFLASPASSYMTGQAIVVDGGTVIAGAAF